MERFCKMQEDLRALEVYYIKLLEKVHEQEKAIKKELAKIRGKYN